MNPALAALDREDTLAGVLKAIRDAAAQHGGKRVSYHFTPVFNRQTSAKTVVVAEGFPERWIELYNDRDFRAVDPIPDAVMKRGTITSWTDALLDAKLTPGLRDFIVAMQTNGLVFGVGFPLFGPHNRNAYAAIGFDQPVPPASEGEMMELHMLLQAGHLRICDLVGRNHAKVRLSGREAEIMAWVGRGKSNADIATILGISPDTVSTYLDRVFGKLGSRSRVGATVRALKLGLIDL